MILVSQNVQIAEEKDFVREKISGIFFVNTSQKILHESAGFLLFTSYLFTLTSNGRIFWEVIGKREEVRSEVAFRFGKKHVYYKG